MLVSPRTGVLKRDEWLDLARKLDWDLSNLAVLARRYFGLEHDTSGKDA